MISKELTVALGFAVNEAKKRRHEYVCIEHILFAILHDNAGRQIIESCGGDIESLEKILKIFFDERLDVILEGDEYILQQTISFQRVIQRAVNHVRSAEKQEVDVGDILVSIFQEEDSNAAYFLKEEGITRLDVLNYLSYSTSKEPSQEEVGRFAKSGKEEKRKKNRSARVVHR